MQVHIIRVDGSEERVEVERLRDMYPLIGADCFDSVNLRDGRVMLVDDTGFIDGKPLNEKATALYRAVCVPGTTHYIAGDVAIVIDAEFA